MFSPGLAAWKYLAWLLHTLSVALQQQSPDTNEKTKYVFSWHQQTFYRNFMSPGISPYTPNPLCDLPLELVEEITSSLQPADLGALRMTCKALHAKAFPVFWKTSLQSIETGLFHTNLQELEMLSRDTRLRNHIKHTGFKGFGQSFEDLGEGYQWGSYRHQSGHPVNLQEHPAAKQPCNILCQLVNCMSLEIIAFGPETRLYNSKFRSTDSVVTVLSIVAKADLLLLHSQSISWVITMVAL